jgi:hypothetical protein
MRLLLLVILVACQRQAAEPPVSAPPDSGALTPSPAVAPSPVVACPAPVVCPPAPRVPAVPPAPSKPGVSIEALLQGVPHFEPARTGHRSDRYLDGVENALRRLIPDDLDQIVPAVHAVITEPGDVQARFLLACTLAQHGLHEHARLELRRLVSARRCPACTDALANVADPFCGFDDKAREIVAAVKPTPLRTAAAQILAAINSGDTSKIDRYLEGTSVLVNECSVCDQPMSTRTPMSRAQFLTFVRGAEKRFDDGPYIYDPPLLLFCDGRCCSGPLAGLTHTQITVTSICFRGPANAPKLEGISALSG